MPIWVPEYDFLDDADHTQHTTVAQKENVSFFVLDRLWAHGFR